MVLKWEKAILPLPPEVRGDWDFCKRIGFRDYQDCKSEWKAVPKGQESKLFSRSQENSSQQI